MVKRRGRQRRDDSSSSNSSSSDMSTPARSPDIHAIIEEAIRKTRSEEAKGIKWMFKELKEELKKELTEMKIQLKKLNEDHIVLHRQLERLNCSSVDVSPAPRSEPNQMQPPRFQLRITSEVEEKVQKGKSIQTNHGNSIEVVLLDGRDPIATDHPLASAWVMMVVLNGEFNKDNNQYNWSKEDFEKSIRRPRHGNSATGDVNQRIESIVSDCTFQLTGGSQRHSDAKILDNSSNKSVRLGVMVLSHLEERVLEGLSNRFLVRDPPKKSKKPKQDLVGCGQEQSGTMPNPQYSSCSTFTQTARNRIVPVPGQLHLPAYPVNNTLEAYPQHSVEPLQQLCSVAGGHHHSAGGAHSPMISDLLMDVPSNSLLGVPDPNYILRPVQLLWDSPGVEPSKHWNLLDQLMPLYSSQRKIHSGDFPTMRLMPEHYDSLTACSQGPYQRLFFNEQALFLKKMTRDLQFTTIPKEVMQTYRNRGVLIQPLEPDDSDDKPPLKRKLRNKYQLRFVNKVCEAYYTGDKIKADDGNLLNVALYDENNLKITSGPLSSASVEVVVLHGDFNATGQDYWASEEFSSCVVCPQSTKEPPAIGGDRALVLVDGQASLGDAFFQKSSIYARTGKFKMGVMLASTSDERVQEGISEPFWVWNRKGGCTGCTAFQRWHTPINVLIFISRLRSGTYRTRKMRRPLLSRDTGDACLELLKEEQCMQDSLLDAWMSEGFGVQLPKAAVTKNVTLLDPQNNGMAPILGKQPMYGGGGGGGGDEVNGCGGGGANDDELSDDGSQAGEKKRRLNVEQVRTLEKNFVLGNKLKPERKILAKRKQLEKDNDALKRQQDALMRQNAALNAELDALRPWRKKLQAEVTVEDDRRAGLAHE